MPNQIRGLLADPRGEMQASPRNKIMGLLADSLGRANAFATQNDPRYADKRQNQTLGLLADAVSLGSLAKTADRMSYGAPLTNARQANVPFLKPETADALMMAPLSPRNALAAASMGMGVADNGAMRAATVWHGSPHKFDKFDAGKIGTGEGAQAYGHGLYLAENKGVAASYKDKLSPDTIARVKNDVYNIAGDDNHILTIYDANGKATKTPYLSPAELDKWVGKDAADMLRLKGDGDYKGLNIDFGNMYKVDLPDNQISRMLDWDKPLSQQAPEVQKILAPVLKDHAASNNPYQPKSLKTVGDAIQHARVNWATGKGQLLEEQLRQAGIPGIRYLDGGSRGAGQGSSNFVVFPQNENMLTILERNGQPIK